MHGKCCHFLPSWHHKTILLVDDQIDELLIVLITVKSMLQICGYSVDAFNDPLLAVEHFSRRSNEYGIMTSDMMMPFMSGIEFIKHVRSFNPEIVTFVITALDSIKDINRDMLNDSTLIELDDFIQKPILLDELCRMVESRSRVE
jgi:CheY-like chemotaxis protein